MSAITLTPSSTPPAAPSGKVTWFVNGSNVLQQIDDNGNVTTVGGASPMTGSNGTVAGTGGTVPAPGADAQGRFLRGDGTWAPGAISGLTYSNGQLTGYTEDGIAYTLAYNGDGTLHTITGGGSVGTLSYTSGVFTGVSYT
jgi:YD repeat-containing protein